MSDRHATCPYRGLPNDQYWKQGMADLPADGIDPAGEAPFKIGNAQKVATAGSCFAQHIATNLEARGFTYFVAEGAPRAFPKEIAREFGYGVFSARFGNIYTARQLVQLFDRAYGSFVPTEPNWTDGERWYDPFRPAVEVGGYLSEEHLIADRERHLACVRAMFEELDVFVFTLGLTEAWESKDDGAIFPIAPGCGFGTADPERYAFRNFTADEVTADLEQFIERLSKVNPSAKVILTVSPVPLIATYEHRHALVSTVFSKSALRVAADVIERRHDHVAYFPSYEIITGPHSGGRYFEKDLRSVRPEGVNHVMRVFFNALAEEGASIAPVDLSIVAATEIICDEALQVR